MPEPADKLLEKIRKNLQYAAERGLYGLPKGEPTAFQENIFQEKKPPSKGTFLEEIRKELGDCTRCPLHEGRTHIVFGVGNSHADLMFVGEAPGRDEDIQGEPFVGRAGRLLNKIITAMGMKREDVYIGNINKCRPLNNRAPLPDEVEACLPFITAQIEAIKPKVIVCLGAVAFQNLLQTGEKISQVRGKWREFRGIKVMPTYHPAFLLRNPNMKRPLWEDMQEVMRYLSSEKGSTAK